MTADVLLFTSPKAGSGAARQQIPRLIDRLDAAAIPNAVVGCPKLLRELVDDRRQQGLPQPVVIAAGGDGTLGLVASHTQADTPLLAMPMGTENLIARHYGLSNDADAVMKTLASGRTMQLDAGLANGRLFLIMATVGFDADVVRRVHLKRKGHIRRSHYLKPMVHSLVRYRFPVLRVLSFDETDQCIARRQVGWAMAFNLPCYAAALKVEPGAIGDDGQLDLITFAGRGIVSGLCYLAGVVGGFHHRFADVDRSRVTRLRIESDCRVAYELDGDYAGRLPLEIKILSHRVRLMIPASP
ncbi:protein BmrU [Stieleria sp. TO1_6]|uniref:diacylglycerol/lipid kinase family protein n=1 Tax=Stieleria tagensis TaxID=2956795 RepID=UPI00209A99D0|nr:diacylglycerol kinase family protein [Stieleria tagensis]MCO8124835.1 protein BmrU [Stieleria tagensis]